MAATDIKIDKVETTFDPEAAHNAYTTTVHATKSDGVTKLVFDVSYETPEDLATAIVASPTVDSGTILDFLP